MTQSIPDIRVDLNLQRTNFLFKARDSTPQIPLSERPLFRDEDVKDI